MKKRKQRNRPKRGSGSTVKPYNHEGLSGSRRRQRRRARVEETSPLTPLFDAGAVAALMIS